MKDYLTLGQLLNKPDISNETIDELLKILPDICDFLKGAELCNCTLAYLRLRQENLLLIKERRKLNEIHR